LRCYGNLSLTATSPVQSFAEPLELADVVKFLELPVRNPPDEAEEAMLDGFIAGARGQAEILQSGKDLCPKQYDLALDFFPFDFYDYEIELRQPLVSVDLVRYRDSDGNYTTLTEGVDYIVDLARGLVLPPYGKYWPTFTPWPSSAVLVRHTTGYASTDAFWADACGAGIKIGMLHLISAWFTGRLPFEAGTGAIQEYPYTVTHLLSSGSVPRVR
jgi:hypothetical protein